MSCQFDRLFKRNMFEVERTSLEKRLNPTAEEAAKNDLKDAETLERALTGDTLQLFQDFEEDKPEEAAKLKVQLLQMVKTGFVKKDEPFTVEQMTRMISGMSSNGSSNAAKARIARNRRNAFDSEDDESDSDLM